MTALKIERMGEQLGVTLPSDMVAKLGLAPDGRLFLTETEDGQYRLSNQNPEFERQLEIGRQVMRDFDATFRELAK